jgi:hypothetical protein
VAQGNYHLAAFAATLATGTDLDVAAVIDDILSIQNSHFVLPRDMDLIMAAAMSATLDRARLASPTMRQIFNPYIRPITVGALLGNNANLQIMDEMPFKIPAWEEVAAQVTVAPGTTEPACVLAWLRAQYVPPPQGRVYPWRFTSTTAAVANSWTTLALTFADALPVGMYAVIGSEHFSTNARAHRIIFPDQVYRPGMPSFASTGQRLPYAISMYHFGEMGRFRSNAIPSVQVLCNGTDAAHTGYLHVVRLAESL